MKRQMLVTGIFFGGFPGAAYVFGLPLSDLLSIDLRLIRNTAGRRNNFEE